MATVSYLGAICGSEGGYGIVFKDFPGCTSAGGTIEEVMLNGRDALQGHIEVMLEYGDSLPAPTTHRLEDVVEWLDDDPEEPLDEKWMELVPIQVRIPASEPDVHVDVPQHLLLEIDKVTSDPRKFVIDAAKRELDRLRKPA